MTDKLLPCPFCGVELYACTYGGGKTRHAHEVNGCVLDRKFIQGEAQEERWNRRAPTPQVKVAPGSFGVEDSRIAYQRAHAPQNNSESDR